MEQPKNNFKIVSNKKTRMILPNEITLIGVCIGLSSIKFALDGKSQTLFDGLNSVPGAHGCTVGRP